MLTAEFIAGVFGNDGQCFETEAGDTLDDVCKQASHCQPTYRNGCGTDVYRYDFEDGSSIVVAGAAWDLGLSQDCFCWAGVGHAGTDCPESPDYEES